jgi:adenylate kinase
MRVAVTGTPGTGKTTATDRLEADLDVVHLNDVIEAEGLTAGTDDARGSWIADLDAVADWLEGRDDVVVESHLAHYFEADRVVVLRCRPAELERRLDARGAPPTKAADNAEAEALDLILAEAVERHGEERVYEVDTTDLGPDEVAAEVRTVVAGEREPSAGGVSFVEYLDGAGPAEREETGSPDPT